MLMVGGAMVGYMDTGRTAMARPPASMMRMAMTQAKTGRSMKKFAISAPGSRVAVGCGPHAHRHARTDALQAGDHHSVPRGQALLHQPLIPQGQGNRDGALLDGVLGRQHQSTGAALGIALNAPLGHQQALAAQEHTSEL